MGYEGMITQAPDRKQLKHFEQTMCDQRWEDLEVGKKTYLHHNRKTRGEFGLQMGTKVKDIDPRNGIPEYSRGDKIYK